MIPGIDPKVDYVFKKLFGNNANIPLLLSLLNAVLSPPPDEQIIDVTIESPFNDKDKLDDKLSIFDIRIRDQLGRQYNVEMEMAGRRIYPNRALYYWLVLYGKQLQEGDHYRLLKPTISVSFVNSVLFPSVPDYHLDFQLRSSRYTNLVFSRHQAMHLLEFPKFKLTADELTTPLDVWCYFLVHGAELDTANLPLSLRTEAIEKAMEVLEMVTKSPIEQQRYEDRIKAERDFRSSIEDAREEGLEQGLEKGLQMGREQGRREAVEAAEIIVAIRKLQKTMTLTITPRDELYALPIEELRTKLAELEQSES